MSDVQHAVDVRNAERFQAEVDRLIAEREKFIAERTKLAAEEFKLRNEGKKIERERAYYPAVLLVSALGAGAALATAVFHFAK